MTIASRVQKDKLLKELSTFGIGGPARYFVEVKQVEEMQEAFQFCKQEKIPFIIIGKGSNSLFDDKGFNGLVILNKIAFIEENKEVFNVGAGYSFSLLGVQTARLGLSGLEFASGIPASVGGAVYMNAGANGSDVSQTLIEVTYITEHGEILFFRKDQMTFGYRFSSFQTMKGAIIAARFQLTSSNEARQKQLKLIEYRTKTQPYGQKSAGCVFRNPLENAAGALIEKSGLKGFSVGGAEVSTMHANFIVNKGSATASDVLQLASHIQHVVLEKTGVHLEMEIRCIPYQV